MANISDANGYLNFKVYCKTENEARNFLLNLKEYLGYGEYAAFMPAVDEIEISKSEDENGVYLISTDFGGFGRWVFDANIQYWFGQWSKQEAVKRFVNEIEKYKFEICFDFVDFEAGFEAFYCEVAIVQHKAGTPLDESDIRVESEGIDINKQNLIDYGYEEYVDYMFPEEDEEYTEHIALEEAEKK